jgi:hypothetical protein
MPRALSTSTSPGPPPWAIPPRTLPARVIPSLQPDGRPSLAPANGGRLRLVGPTPMRPAALRSGRSVRKTDALPNRPTDRTHPTGGRSVPQIAALSGSPTGQRHAVWRNESLEARARASIVADSPRNGAIRRDRASRGCEPRSRRRPLRLSARMPRPLVRVPLGLRRIGRRGRRSPLHTDTHRRSR